MKNKYLLLLISIFCLISFSSIAQDFWEVVPTPDSANLVSIAIHNNGDIFLGSNGVYLSQDDGETWEFKGLFGKTIYSIDIDSMNNIFVGTTGRVYKSSDYGDSWEEKLLVLGNILSIKAGDDGLIFAGSGHQIAVLRSLDYGQTWDTALTMLETEQANDIEIAPNGDVFVGATAHMIGAGGVYRSQDNGSNWEHIGLLYHYIYAVETDNSCSIVYAGAKGHHYTGEIGFYKFDSTLGFWNHTKNNVTINDILISVNDDIYIGCTIEVGGHAAGVFRSFDHGENWEDISNGLIVNSVPKLSINPNHYLYAITDSPNTLNRSVDPIIVSIYNSTLEIFDIQVYPNPCRDYIWISFPFILLNSRYGINIYNSSGTLIEAQNNIMISDHSIDLDLSKINHVRGLLYLQIYNDYQVFTKKLIKL